MPKAGTPVKKSSYSISVLTYRKLIRFLESGRGPTKQVNLFKAAVDVLKANPSVLGKIPTKVRGSIKNKTSRVLVNTFDEDSVKTVEALAEEYSRFNGQVVDAAFHLYIGDKVLSGEELQIPIQPVPIKGWKWPQGSNQTDDFHLSLSRAPQGVSIFVDATVLFAGITSVNRGNIPQSEQCARFLRQCLDREYKAITTLFELGRLEQLLTSFAPASPLVANWLSVLLHGIPIVEVTYAELAPEEPLAPTISAKAAIIAMAKQREPNSIASISNDFDVYCKRIFQGSRKREEPPAFLIPTIYKPLDLPS